MTPKGLGGRKTLRDRVGLLFATVFLLATLRWLVQGWLEGLDWGPLLLDSRFWLVALLGLIFVFGLKFPVLRRVEPYIFLSIAVIPFTENPDSIYAFGFFCIGGILLFVDGQLSSRPVLKMCLLAGYLTAVVIVSTLITHRPASTATGLLLFMGGFFLFLFLTFQDKIVIFVRAAKPIVSLSEKGLTEKESEHLLALIKGLSMKEIAWAHKVKESTVRNSLSRAYRKLGVGDQVQLQKWAQTRDVRP